MAAVCILHDGPIDLIVEAFGERAEIEAAYRAAAQRFVTVLDELCAELPLLRSAVRPMTGKCRMALSRAAWRSRRAFRRTLTSLLPWRLWRAPSPRRYFKA